MYIQFFYGINSPPKLFAKRFGKHYEDLGELMRSHKKSAFIDNNLTLDFIWSSSYSIFTLRLATIINWVNKNGINIDE